MRYGWPLPLLVIALLAWQLGTLRTTAADPPPGAGTNTEKVVFAKQVAPLLKQYCTKCHGGEKPRAGLALDRYKEDAAAQQDQAVWEKVAANLRAGEMPPKDKAQPTPAEKAVILAWVESQVAPVDCFSTKNPGRVTLRRLNRAEYNNTIRYLLGVAFQPADDFPADDVGYGFDNIGDVLSLPPLLLERYLAAAEKIVTAALSKPETRQRILLNEATDQKNPDVARKILENFASRAYRRPATNDEVTRLLRLVEKAQKDGDSFEESIGLAVQAVLVSPHFLFKVELDRSGDKPGSIHVINDWELSTRLSYFLWSSMPDEELFELARKGELAKDGNLEAQVRRMMSDPKAHALVENFAGQWLQLRNLKTANPDPGHYKGFDESLRTAMLKETELFFETIVAEDRSVLEFLDADYTFLNERLAKHYGIPDVQGDEFRRVKLTGDQRGGVLSQASILTITSNPTRTSPVKRGKWILENILGTPPPPPPPDAGELSEKKAAIESASLRKRMEQHRANAICASCHQRMDPLGFGFENYDGVGAWRTEDGKFPIDATGTLPDGKSFNGPKELKAILLAKDKEFRRCLSEKLLTYALGRGLEGYDKCAVDQIADALAKNENHFSSLLIAIVQSEPFRQRRSPGGDAK
jgi:mono/diheme cytochrome c family protein